MEQDKPKKRGRKAGVKVGPYKENPKNTMLPFRVSAATARRVRALRELTKGDAVPFVDSFEEWVRRMAEDYGLD